MSKQAVRDLMSADYRKYVADIYAAYPIQRQNAAYYERFEADAQLGSMVRKVRLKGGGIDKGAVVFYTAHESEAGRVVVWYQGCMCPAVVKKSAVKAL